MKKQIKNTDYLESLLTPFWLKVINKYDHLSIRKAHNRGIDKNPLIKFRKEIFK